MRIAVPTRAICLALMLGLLTACGGSGGTSSTSASSPGTSPPATNKSAALLLSGTPPGTATVGQSYSFTPSVSGASGTVTFSIKNAPTWVTFSTSTGQISGTPQAADAGIDTNIVISASDPQSSASLSAFNVTVAAANSGSGNATLTWSAPTTNTDGSTLSDLAGYRIYYGTRALNNVVTVSGALNSYVFEALSAGTWYFAVRSYTTAGTQSPLSNLVSMTIS